MQAQPSTSTSAAARISAAAPLPQQLTACICSTASVHKLAKLIEDNSDDLNTIHVAASIVRLANLVGGGCGEAAEMDESGDQNNGKDRKKGVASAAHGRPRPEKSVKELMSTLGQKYVEFCGRGMYTGARQHANIAWAVGKIGGLPPPGLIEELTSQLLEDGRRRLKAASSQVSVNPHPTMTCPSIHLPTI